MFTTTYDRLRTTAGLAVGRVELDGLEDWELDRINSAPNKGVDRVALARRWPTLIRTWTLTIAAGDLCTYLPADFQALERDDELNYSAGAGAPPLVIAELREIMRRRALGSTSAYPLLAAAGAAEVGGANDRRVRLELWPTPDATYSLIGTYRRQPASMSVGTDAPDLPYELHAAVEVATGQAARRDFMLPLDGDREAELEALIESAAARLLPMLMSGEPLRDVIQRPSGLPRGRNMNLDPSYPWT